MHARPRSSHDDLLRRAQNALDEDHFEEAEALGRRALMLQPDSLDARQVIASAVIEQGGYEEAVLLLEEILAVEPADLASLSDLGLCLFEMVRFDRAESVLRRALEVDAADPQSCYWMALCLERQGPAQFAAADELFQRAHRSDPEAYPLPTRFSAEEFQEIVEEALDELPEVISSCVRNGTVSIHVADLPRIEDLLAFDEPADPCLFGLHTGTPLTERSLFQTPQLPDIINIYKRNLERMFHERDELADEIRITLLHEIGHYLGMDEEALEEGGFA
ncbi:MAG: metallopeptidase family protein [Acidobacteria bacterium]|jgi:predicted Zn-dependent protease with MMP-like domain|nr:metallopeptidase family protein [Acidobacteriota bacterium]